MESGGAPNPRWTGRAARRISRRRRRLRPRRVLPAGARDGRLQSRHGAVGRGRAGHGAPRAAGHRAHRREHAQHGRLRAHQSTEGGARGPNAARRRVLRVRRHREGGARARRSALPAQSRPEPRRPRAVGRGGLSRHDASRRRRRSRRLERRPRRARSASAATTARSCACATSITPRWPARRGRGWSGCGATSTAAARASSCSRAAPCSRWSSWALRWRVARSRGSCTSRSRPAWRPARRSS